MTKEHQYNLRKHVRIPVRWQVEVQLAGNNGRVLPGITENVSSAGVGLLLQESPPDNTKAYLKFFAMIRGCKVTFDAVVLIRHASLSGGQYRCGCLFLKLHDTRRKMIELLVDESIRTQDALRVA